MKKFITNTLSIALSSIHRFTLPFIASVVVTACLILSVEFSESFIFYRIAVGAGIAFPFLILLKLCAEFRKLNSNIALCLSVIAGLALAAYGFYYTPTEAYHLNSTYWYRTILILLVTHLGIALTPLLATSSKESLWSFNLKLFLQFFFSSINAAVLFIGLAIALLSVEKLFGLDLEEDLYLKLWIACTFLVHPLLFLGGVPQANDPQKEIACPRALHFSLRFIALPLSTTYLLILYLYVSKILLQWSWPNGWVAMPILILALISLFTYLLSEPLTERTPWAKLYHRWIFRLIFPLSIVLFLALQIRLNNYGLTINRYFGIALALWLLALSLIHILRHRLHPACIPASLFAVTLFALCAGPFSVFSWSERAQIERVHILSEKLGMIEDGILQPAETEVDSENAEQLKSSLRYIIEAFGEANLTKELTGFYASPQGDNFKESRKWNKYSLLFEYLEINGDDLNATKFEFSGPEPTLGHAYRLADFYVYNFIDKPQTRIFSSPHGSIKIEFSSKPDGQWLHLYLNKKTLASLNLETKISEIIEVSKNAHRSPDEQAIIIEPKCEIPDWKVSLVVKSATIENKSKQIKTLNTAIYCDWAETQAP